ncbi:hypothetical protein PQU92_09095 [Asticcacaulis sp. BYS171W]|uniref:Uncharacterized protein n=1 Tax=Asticcacaulis aquaticus TaxID=2984212 RepID=A0ABT5HTP5_9CAUL|nr:hypothetical protein [Asticcacaulis aquaticus]MDC7683430.1 hypothetical protein [Asticcacaulis aquaticus]
MGILKRLYRVTAFAVFTFGCGVPAMAADNAEAPTVTIRSDGEANVPKYNVQLDMPGSIALTLLGRQPDAATAGQLGSMWAVSAAASQSDIPDISWSFRPYWTVTHRYQDLDTYNREATPLGRLYARSRIDLATATVEAEGRIKTRLALGVQTSFNGKADPAEDVELAGCLHQAVQLEAPQAWVKRAWTEKIKPKLVDMGVGTDRLLIMEDRLKSNTLVSASIVAESKLPSDKQDLLIAFLAGVQPTRPLEPTEKAGKCFADARNRYLWEVERYAGLGQVWSADNKSLSHLVPDGLSVWAGIKVPLGDDRSKAPKDFLSLQARYTDVATVDIAKDTPKDIREGTFAFAYTRSWAGQSLVLGASYNRRDFKEASLADVEFTRISVAWNHRISQKLWLSVSAGRVSKSLYEDGDYTLIKLNFSEWSASVK